MINSSLAKKYGSPLNLSEGNHTKASSDRGNGSKASSIMKNPWTRSDRCGYGVGGVGGKSKY